MSNEPFADSDTKEMSETPRTAEYPSPRTGPVWENRGSTSGMAAFFRTVGDVLFCPRATFSQMRTSPRIGAAYLFYLVPNGVAFVISRVLEGMARAFFALFLPPEMASSSEGVEGIVINALGILFLLFFPFFFAALTHLFLIVVNGQRYGYAATFRVGAYSSGSVALFDWIPCLGWLVAPIWSLVLSVVGLAAIHETSLGKAAFAAMVSVVLLGVVAILGLFAAWATGLLEPPMPPTQV